MNDNQAIARRNRRTCLQLEFVWPFFFGTPYMATYYTVDKGLLQDEVFMLQVILQMTMIIVGIPFGFLADRYGLRRMAILGSLLQCAALTAFVFCDSFWQFALTLVGTGLYFAAQLNITGSVMMSSLGYVTDESERQARYRAYEIRAALFRSMGIVAGIVVGGTLIACHATPLIYQLQPAVAIVGLLIALRVVEPAFHHAVHSGMVVLRNVARCMLIERPGIRSAIMLSVSIQACGFACFWMFQPRLQAAGIKPEYFGAVYFAYQLAALVFSRFIGLFRGTKGERDLPFWQVMAVGLPCVAIVTGLTTNLAAVVILMFVQLCSAILVRVLLRTFMYETLPNDYSTRTAELSVSTTATSIGCAIAGSVASIVTAFFSVGTAFFVMGVLSASLGSLALRTFRRHVRQSR